MSRTFGASSNRWINKRNFKNYLITWLGNLLQVGPALGDVKFLATADSTWEDNLLYCGVPSSDIFHTLETGEDALTGSQHDVLCVCPGSYDVDTQVNWDKSWTHMVGLGGPPLLSEYTIPNATIYTDSTSVATVMYLTGHYCQFHYAGISNNGANAGCLSAVYINGYGNTFKWFDMIGNMNSTQSAVEAAASVYFGASMANCLFEDCNIGSNAWATRTAAKSGQIYFPGTSGGGGPSNTTLRRCNILSRAETNTICMVELPANNCCARGWLFDQCYFDNFWVNHGGTLNAAFYDACGTTHNIVLRNCSSHGIARWYTADNGCIFTAQANSQSAGGISVEATGD